MLALPKGLWRSLADNARDLPRHGTKGRTMMAVNNEILAQVMAEFESGTGLDAPFDLSKNLYETLQEHGHENEEGQIEGRISAEDLDDAIGEDWTDTAYAFANDATTETHNVSGGTAQPKAYVYAGLLQGLCIGYRYCEVINDPGERELSK
jgi:hypothetical protein